MAEDEDVKEFPDVTSKLAAPKKLSAYEKERQAAEAKKQRAEAENAAALKEFEDSFANDRDDDGFPRFPSESRAPNGPRGSVGGYGFGRGMAPMGPRSGPGSLGPSSGGPPPPMSLKRKRALDEMREAQEARREQGAFGHEGEVEAPRRPSDVNEHEEEKESEAPKPTVHLSSLPPGTSVEELKAILSPLLKVYSVRFLAPSGPGVIGKKVLTAIATLSSEVTTAQIDNAVSSLRDRYVGCGFYLSISRHLSSSTFHPSMSGGNSSSTTEPFGAKSVREQRQRFPMGNAPPPGDQRGFAPPEYYDRRGLQSRNAESQIPVQPPLEIATIRAIHTISDRILTETDPDRALELEALFMSLPEVQKDERFAFLYDSRSLAGIYYRFCLWGPDSPDEQKRRARGPERVFSDTDMDWLPPYKQVPFPDLSNLSQAVTDIDYVSSDEESDDDGAQIRPGDGPERDGAGQQSEPTFLTPLQRARFTHLLARLPSINTRLRMGDIARVTSFAINHAGCGAEQIVDLLLLNVEKPFAHSLAAKFEDSDAEEAAEPSDEEEYDPEDPLPTIEEQSRAVEKVMKDDGRENDASTAKLVALYAISDILSASSTAGARNAWKYRQVFEAGFKHQRTFERLGKLDRELGWGKLKAEQWKRKIGAVFSIWENWSVFSTDVHEELKRSFFEPPLSEAEKIEAAREEEKAQEEEQELKWKSRFKKLEASASASPAPQPATPQDVVPEELDGGPMELDGAPMDDVDGNAMQDIDIDGAAMVDEDGGAKTGTNGTITSNAADVLSNENIAPLATTSVNAGGSESDKVAASFSYKNTPSKSAATGPKRRMRAEDMFADSDEE